MPAPRRIESGSRFGGETAPAGEPVKEYVESVALWSRAELEIPAPARGLRGPQCHWQLLRAPPFGPTAPRLIVLCVRAGAG